MTLPHDSIFGKLASCAGALGVGWGSLLSNTQSVMAIVAALAATVYSIYMFYDLWDRRRKNKQ